MKCTDLESLLCDYVDGTLSNAEKATVELHLEGCPACRELVADSRAVVSFMEKAADVEPPAALVNQILFEVRTGKSSPVKKSGAARSWISKLLEPVLQPLISAYWSWSGQLATMRQGDFFVGIDQAVPTTVVSSPGVGVSMLMAHILCGLVAAWIGCKRHLWD